MTITSVNEEKNICVTVDKVKDVKLESIKDPVEYALHCNGYLVANSKSRTTMLDLFKQLSTKIVTDTHYCIVEANNNKYSVLPYDPSKF